MDETISVKLEFFADDYVPEEVLETPNPGDLSLQETSSDKREVKKEFLPIAEKRKIRHKTKFSFAKDRKLQGMKSYELREILDTNVIKFCQDIGLIASSVTCYCGKPMVFSRKYNNGKISFLWRCRSRNSKIGNPHTTSSSIRKGTWFEKSKLSFAEILWMAYLWLYEYSLKSVMHECDNTYETILDWFVFCREVSQCIIENKNEPLGGLGKIVEIFSGECVEKLTEDQRVFCALEQFSGKLLLIFLTEKSSESVFKLFDTYILPDSTVVTNYWAVFRNLSESEFNSLISKKSITFYDPVSKTEIEDISQLQKVADREPSLKYTYSTKFCEQMYRKSLSYSDDAYLTFLKDVAKIYTPLVKCSKS